MRTTTVGDIMTWNVITVGPTTPWRKAAGLTAADVMTSPAVTVSTGTALPQVARRLAPAGVRRLVVVDDGRLVGVVARRDLLRIFLRGDPDIKAEIDRDVLDGALHANMTSNVRSCSVNVANSHSLNSGDDTRDTASACRFGV
jgi:CBS domain-containing protein